MPAAPPLANITWTCSPIRPTIAGPAPLLGTCTIFVPAL
jgi:hypothetical protein